MHDLTTEQIRDRLARIARPDWCGCESLNPIPPLDSPEALGVVEGMLPEGWAWDRIEFWQDVLEVEAWACHPEKICVVGRSPTETIARSLAVIAAHEAEGARPC